MLTHICDCRVKQCTQVVKAKETGKVKTITTRQNESVEAKDLLVELESC